MLPSNRISLTSGSVQSNWGRLVAQKESERLESGMASVELEAQLHVALDNMPGALVYTDEALRIVFCNERFKEMYQVSKKLGITHWYMITEKKLWYALKRFDLIFRQIGEPVNYHGLRIPYLGIVEEIEQSVVRVENEEVEEILEEIRDKNQESESENQS